MKKVTDNMKTHKNPNLRLQSAVPFKAAKTVSKVTTPVKPAAQVTRPAKFALEANKWVIVSARFFYEYFKLFFPDTS